MSIPIEPIIYGLIFVAVLVLVEGIYLTVFGKSISLNNRVNRRLFKGERLSGFAYPIMRAARNLLIRAKGVAKINNLKK